MKPCFFRNATSILMLSIFALSFTSLQAQNLCSGELILQPAGSAGKDAHVSNWQPNQPGASTAHWLTTAAWTISGTPTLWHTYIDFDWSALPAGAQVLSATLDLYGVSTGGSDLSTHSCLSGSNNSIIRRVTGPWDEATMTWNTQPGTTSLNELAVPSLCTPNQNISLNVTSLVQDMLDNPSTSFGFQMSLATEQHYRGLIFGSSEHPDSTKHPKLVVKYTYPCPCTGQLVLQPDSETGKDAPVLSRPDVVNSNFENYPSFAAQAWTWSGTPGVIREYFDFDLSTVPAGATISSATLSLTAWPWNLAGEPCLSGSNEAYVRRVTSPWAENTITWNNQPNVTTAGQKYIPALCAINTNLNIDLTAMIQDMVNDPLNNFGLQFALITEDYYRAMLFHSSDSDEAAKRPKLVVQYTFPCPCTGQQVLQPGSETGKDAHVLSKPDVVNSNFGNYPLFAAQAWTWSGTPGVIREYFDFDLSTVPAGATITSATLSLTAWPWNLAGDPCLSGSNEAYVRRVTSPWAENTITWNNQPNVTTAGQKYIPALCAINTDLNIDLTTMIQDMVDDPINNFGLQFALITEDYYRAMLFHSSDSDEAAKRPKLVVQYNFPCDPSVSIFEKPIFQNTVQLFPNPTTGEINLQFEQPLEEKATLRVFSLQGQLLREALLTSGAVSQQLDLTLFPAGLYLVMVQTESGAVWHSKIVKQ